MGLGLSMHLGLTLSHVVPSVVVATDIGSLEDDDLARLLEESLESIKAHKESNPKNGNGNGNFYNTSSFMSAAGNAANNARARGFSSPSYRVVMGDSEVKVQGLKYYPKSKKVLESFKRDEASPPQNTFSKRILETLDFVDTKKSEAIQYVLKKQREAIELRDVSKLTGITQVEIAENIGLHSTTVSRLVNGLSFEYNGREFLLSDLIPGTGLDLILSIHYLLDISRERGLTNHKWDLSDQKMVANLSSKLGKSVARRTVNKYRRLIKESHMRFGADNPREEIDYVKHWSFERPIKEEEIIQIINGDLTNSDLKSLAFYKRIGSGVELALAAGQLEYKHLDGAHPAALWYLYAHRGSDLNPDVKVVVVDKINSVASKCNSFSTSDLDYFIAQREQ